MVKVCDAIMGSGKSSSAIRYMNEHPEKRFVYITPYKKEADRIQQSCKELRFIRPSDKLHEYKFSIRNHTAALIKAGRNIATTHQAFKFYTTEMKKDIAEKGYTLIIDENIDLMEEVDFSAGDLQFCIDAGSVVRDGDEIKLVNNNYTGDVVEYKRFFSLLQDRNILCLGDDGTGDGVGALHYWILPPDLITSFDDVIIMTYMFEGQEAHHFLVMNNIEYSYIYVSKDKNGFKFSNTPSYVPEYTRHLREMIHILDNKKLNSIGDADFALSLNWCSKPENKDLVSQLKNNIYNYFRNITGASSDNKMWGCFARSKSSLKGKGYTNAFVSFNEKATNEYAKRDTLVYAVNIYMNVSRKLYFVSKGIKVDDDAYALSIMVQWIWRSAIRDGKEIDIYIPSRRMRTLLINWMDSLAEGGELHD